jgi:hypothetical protein
MYMLFDRVLLVLSMFSRGSSKNSESSAPGTPMAKPLGAMEALQITWVLGVHP